MSQNNQSIIKMISFLLLAYLISPAKCQWTGYLVCEELTVVPSKSITATIALGAYGVKPSFKATKNFIMANEERFKRRTLVPPGSALWVDGKRSLELKPGENYLQWGLKGWIWIFCHYPTFEDVNEVTASMDPNEAYALFQPIMGHQATMVYFSNQKFFRRQLGAKLLATDCGIKTIAYERRKLLPKPLSGANKITAQHPNPQPALTFTTYAPNPNNLVLSAAYCDYFNGVCKNGKCLDCGRNPGACAVVAN